MIPFNKPYLTGNEFSYIQSCLESSRLCGNGVFTKRCESYFQQATNARKCCLTTSCTDALEMCALLCDIQAGDEVIVPAYTFVSSALAFTREGAKIVFADSRADNPCVDETKLEVLITPKTKAIVAVHYAGIACEMDTIMRLAEKYKLYVIEDAAQGFDSYYNGKPLGSIGHLAVFSFHETKNIQCGEGGLLVVNRPELVSRAEIIWEKGTNRAEFYRNEVDKYGWKDTGSSFLPAEYVAAFLYAQLEKSNEIQQRRKEIWEKYEKGLKEVLGNRLQPLPPYATNNYHMLYFVCDSLDERSGLIAYLAKEGIASVFHYISLHKSTYMRKRQGDFLPDLPQSDKYTDCLVRIPFFNDLAEQEIDYIIQKINYYFNSQNV